MGRELGIELPYTDANVEIAMSSSARIQLSKSQTRTRHAARRVLLLLLLLTAASCTSEGEASGGGTGAAGPVSAAPPAGGDEGETGLYAQLSPQLSGGRFIDASGGRPGEVSYISEQPELVAADLAGVEVESDGDTFALKVTLTPEARARLRDDLNRMPLSRAYAIVLLHEGRARSSHGLGEVLAGEHFVIAGFEDEGEAAAVAARLRED